MLSRPYKDLAEIFKSYALVELSGRKDLVPLLVKDVASWFAAQDPQFDWDEFTKASSVLEDGEGISGSSS